MSARLRRNIEAAQRFLQGLKTLPLFQETRLKQVCSLEANLERSPHLTTEEAGSMISLLDDGIWGSELARLKEAIAFKVSRNISSDSMGRRSNQDYMELSHYLTQDLWDLLRGTTASEAHKLDALVRHCGKLGLRNPNESSKALIVALSHAMHNEPFPEEKLRLVGKYRSRITKGLENLPQPAVHLPLLPVDPAQLPESISAVAFAGQARVEVPRGVPDFQALARAWPVRNRGKSEAVSLPAGQSVQSLAAFGHVMHGMMQASQELHRGLSCGGLERKPSLLPLEDKRDSSQEKQVITVLPARQKEETTVTEEVKDALEKTLPKRRKKEAAGDAESVEETLARLRDGCRKKEKDEGKSNEGKRKAAMKKPAAAGRGGAVGLRDQEEKVQDLSAGQSCEIGHVASPPFASKGCKKELSAGQSSEIGNVASPLLASKGRKKKLSVAQSSDIGHVASPLLASKGRKTKLSAGQSSDIGHVASPPLASKGRKTKLSAGQSSEIRDVASSLLASKGRKKIVAQKKLMSEQSSQGCVPNVVVAGASAGRAGKLSERQTVEKAKPKAPKSKKATRAADKSYGCRGNAEAREAKRQKVLALVPEQLKQEYAKGCGRCRGRSFCTVSCWRARGFSLDGE